ncbi:MAG: AAA family ATPase, partial [Kiritimatiellae bacterium]|nr:AAA family ATPase [Kiritimatiellia bacterium]
MASNVIDRPAAAGEDSLDMNAYAEALTKFIKDAEAPLTIALQGEWGSGKTSLMNALKKNLVDDDGAPYFGVWVNTWQYALMSDPEEAIVKILLGIIGQITSAAQTPEEERRNLFKKVLSVGRSVVTQVVAKQTGVDIDKTIDAIKEDGNASGMSSVESLKKELGSLIDNTLKNKRGYLFFIDDLDRIDPPVAVQILELLKNIFDLEKCIFVLAIDYGVVVKGLKPKFGEMTPENEREFRSFFDKIIQLPFSMPVGSYKIDKFLMSSLVKIGYIEAKEENDKTLCEAMASYTLDSVGTNPRALKRLINYLSLIRLLIDKTESKEDDNDLKNWKDILFALVSLQIQYPKVYDALVASPDFPKWGAEFEQTMHLPALKEGEAEKLKTMTEFDELWEQMLFRFCRRDAFLEARALNISRILNRIKARIEASNANGGSESVGDTVEWLLRLSAVTNVKSESAQQSSVENFSKSQYLNSLKYQTLGMEWTTDRWLANLDANTAITSTQKRLQSNFACCLWKGTIEEIADCLNYLCHFNFHIFHDGRSFQLKMWGEFWGNTPEKPFSIDFAAADIQPDLAAAEDAYRSAWTSFEVAANIGHHS